MTVGFCNLSRANCSFPTKLSLVFLFLSFVCIASAQKINRQYAFYPQKEGNLYFFYPQKGFSSTNKDAVKGLEYDITYLSGKDSATYSFSYFTENVINMEKFTILDVNGSVLYSAPLTMMFVQPKKSYWYQRAQVMIPYELLDGLYRKEEPYTIRLEGGKALTYTIKSSAWKKQAAIVGKIWDVVKYNK